MRKRLSDVLEDPEFDKELQDLKKKRPKLLEMRNTLKASLTGLQNSCKQNGMEEYISTSTEQMDLAIQSISNQCTLLDAKITDMESAAECLYPGDCMSRVRCSVCITHSVDPTLEPTIFLKCGHSMCLSHFQQLQVHTKSYGSFKCCPECRGENQYLKPNTEVYNPYTAESDIVLYEDNPRQ